MIRRANALSCRDRADCFHGDVVGVVDGPAIWPRIAIVAVPTEYYAAQIGVVFLNVNNTVIKLQIDELMIGASGACDLDASVVFGVELAETLPVISRCPDRGIGLERCVVLNDGIELDDCCRGSAAESMDAFCV